MMRRDYALAAGAATVLAAAITAILIATGSPASGPAGVSRAAPELTAATAIAARPNAGAATSALASAGPVLPWPSGAISAAPDGVISLDEQQALIADQALRSVMESYLIAGRLPALREHLRRILPPAAAQEAVSLAERYNAYLAEHDSLLAVQNLAGAPDAARLAVWQQQRQQLRVRMLGERVTQEWFGTEDAYLSQALTELAPGPGPTPVNEDELRHQAHMQQVLRDAVTAARSGAGDSYGANK
jgi:hypothetical protein